MPSRAVDAFIYVWKMLDQHWAKTKLACQCVRNANSLILILLKPFLSYMLWPRTSMPICSNRLGSQGESSKETTDIAMWESRWCQLCHRFRSLQDFLLLFICSRKLTLNEEPWLEWPRRKQCFLRFAHLGLFLDILVFACLNYVKKSYPPCVHSNCQPLAWKRPLWLWECHKVVICYLLIPSDISWQCLVCSWVFGRFFLSFHARGKLPNLATLRTPRT